MSSVVSHTAGRTLQRTRKPDLASIVRGSATTLADRLSAHQKKAFGAIAACRTAKLGGQRFCCDDCGFEKFVYHSCRHRACPKCQTQARQKWLADRKAELLPVPYFHLVFTLPHSLNPLIGWNEKHAGIAVVPGQQSRRCSGTAPAQWHRRAPAVRSRGKRGRTITSQNQRQV